ncbi:MAG: CHAT domain-containing protein [Phormidesmis sp.]
MKNCVERMSQWRSGLNQWRYGLLMLITCIVVTIYGQCASGAMLTSSIDHHRSLVSLSSVDSSLVDPLFPDSTDNVGSLEPDSLGNRTATVDGYLDSGQAFYNAGQFKAAISDWKQALALAQNTPYQKAIAHNYVAIGYQSLNNWSQANNHIQQGLQLLSEAQSPTSQSPTAQDSTFLTAQLLNTQGSIQLQTGHAAKALETWQHAIDLYQTIEAGDTTLAIARTRINQSLALRVLGFYRRAKTSLDKVKEELPLSAPVEVKIAVLQSLGKTLIRIGDPGQAKLVFQEALTLTQTSEQQAVVTLNLAGALVVLGERQEALLLFQQAKSQGRFSTQLEASLEALSLQFEAADDLALEQPKMAQELQLLLTQLSIIAPSRWGVNSQVYLANLLIDKVGVDHTESWGISPKAIGQLLAQALSHSRSLQDHQAEASVLAQLGHLYEQTQQWDEAINLTQQALRLQAMSDSNSYANAQGQWQLARILKALGFEEDSLTAYSSAVNQLDALQYDIVSLNPDAKFSFRDRIEPVYREYVELLLADVQKQPAELQQKQLQQARETIEALQLAELQNYFREACLTYQTREIEAIDPQAAIVYPILLNNRIDVIVSIQHQPLVYYSSDFPARDREKWFRSILSSLHPASPVDAVLPLGQQLYSWLLAPVASQLEQQGIETLVFVPDDFLRNIPMAILHDGDGYLLERYNLVLTPSMQLLNSQPLALSNLKTLTAGLTTARQGFSPLPAVDQEIDKIEELVPANVLLNSQFTKENIFEQSRKNDFSIIHLATHGEFSASAEETFLLTWNDRINVKDLGELFQASQRRDAPIELLVLSACQTALGDRQAALGMAGVAIESGARSTVATLWSVQDESTSSVMGEFYRQLVENQKPRAKALRDAQLRLMQNPSYQHPYYWAPFVMIGNWQ